MVFQSPFAFPFVLIQDSVLKANRIAYRVIFRTVQLISIFCSKYTILFPVFLPCRQKSAHLSVLTGVFRT